MSLHCVKSLDFKSKKEKPSLVSEMVAAISLALPVWHILKHSRLSTWNKSVWFYPTPGKICLFIIWWYLTQQLVLQELFCQVGLHCKTCRFLHRDKKKKVMKATPPSVLLLGKIQAATLHDNTEQEYPALEICVRCYMFHRKIHVHFIFPSVCWIWQVPSPPDVLCLLLFRRRRATQRMQKRLLA